jgi:hypothetical protein
MRSSRAWKAVAIPVAVFAWAVFQPGIAAAQQEAGKAPCPPDRLSLEQLAQMSWPDLECLYRASGPGTIPVGYARGRPIYCPDAPLAAARSKVTRLLWHGKHFSACDGTLVNQWCGFKAIRARVSYGDSWLDGAAAIVMDYGGTSRLWADVRDEVREVAPGLYLGAMFLRRDPQPQFKMFFALECLPPGGGD